MNRSPRTTPHAKPAIVSLALLCGLVLPAVGGAEAVLQSGPRISDARLDALRGGYDVNSLLMSIGIARVVFINGEPVVTTTLNIPALNANIASIRAAAVRMAGAAGSPVASATSAKPGAMPTSGVTAPATTATSSKPAASASGAVTSATRNATPVVTVGSGGLAVIQNGAGNTVALQNLPSAGAIIQNTLDNQSIRSVTTIDAKVFTRSIMQGMNLSASMNEAFKRPVTR
jgi:hypothetical protein